MSDLLSSTEVCRRTGATYRQLDHWVRSHIVEPHVDAHGSGHRRRWRVEQLPAISTLVRVADAFETSSRRGVAALGGELMARIVESHEVGCIELDHGVRITWSQEVAA